MAARVPKFGSWDGQNVSYTACFENARKDRAAGVRMNPNDPKVNPDAFIKGGGQTHRFSHEFHAPAHVNSTKSRSGEQYNVEGRKQQTDHRRKISDYHKTRKHRSRKSESGSEKGKSEASLMKPHLHRTRSEQRQSFNNGSNDLPPPSPRPCHGQRGGSNVSDDMSYRSASVPKFGSWDKGDLSGEGGFTGVFEKVKEEKHIAKLPTVPSSQPKEEKHIAKLLTVPSPQPPPPSPPPQTHNDWNKSPNKGWKSKVCCWLNPCGND